MEVPDHTIENLVRFGIIDPVSPGPGIPREFDFFDLVCTELAILMRADKLKTDEIKQAMDLLKQNRQKFESRTPCGLIFKTTILDAKIDPDFWEYEHKFVWKDHALVALNADKSTDDIYHIPGYWYSVSGITSELRFMLVQHAYDQ